MKTAEEMAELLRKTYEAHSVSQSEWAKDNGLSQSYVNLVAAGRRPMGKKILAVLGYKKAYVKIDKGD